MKFIQRKLTFFLLVFSAIITAASCGEQIRLVSREELATKTEQAGSKRIWLSILGEVYDVTEGKDSFYSAKAAYGSFAGVDATVPFVSGVFTAEEAEKTTEKLSPRELLGLKSWRDFYRNHQVYQYIGLLVDPRYFDEQGEPTAQHLDFERRLKLAEKADAERKARKNEKPKKGNLSNHEILKRVQSAASRK